MNETYRLIVFGKKASEAKISRKPNMEKSFKNILFNVH